MEASLYVLQYIFEGLGQLISTVLIRGGQDVRRINENGVKKMCRNIFSIQQTLCNITNQPEHALDHARQYYELFLHPIEVCTCTLVSSITGIVTGTEIWSISFRFESQSKRIETP